MKSHSEHPDFSTFDGYKIPAKWSTVITVEDHEKWADIIRRQGEAKIKLTTFDNPVTIALFKDLGHRTWRLEEDAVTCLVCGGEGLKWNNYKVFYAHNARHLARLYDKFIREISEGEDYDFKFPEHHLQIKQVGYKINK